MSDTLSRRAFVLSSAALLGLASMGVAVDDLSKRKLPNIIIYFCDDMGYADPSCFGSKTISTPNIDQIAKDGVKFTDFYVAQPVCTASRAGLLTGCYPNRIGIAGAWGVKAQTGISSQETTLPQMLKSRGYATCMVGKWHLGDAPEFLPTKKGFDEWLGTPYSNDMWPQHPESRNYPPLIMYDGDKPLINDVTAADQALFNKRLIARAIQFIEKKKNDPFFLYFANPMPHVPIFASDDFKGKSGQGLYADVIEEIDWSVGELLKTLKKNGLDDNTLFIFTSDNGPWLRYGNHAGSAKPLREGKGTVYEGGIREPFVARWPGVIPAGVVQHEPAMTIDLLPTIAKLVDAPLPALPIDGKDIMPLIKCENGAKNPHDAYYFYYASGQLQAVRVGKWKLILPHIATQVVGDGPVGKDGIPTPARSEKVELSLYDLEKDISETTNVVKDHPDILDMLMHHVETARAELGDTLTKRIGAGVRAVGRIKGAKDNQHD